MLLSNTSSIYIQVKQEDIETESHGDSESEEYRIETDTSRAYYGLWLLLELALVNMNFLSIWTVSLPIFKVISAVLVDLQAINISWEHLIQLSV